MSTAYSKQEQITTVGANELVAIPFPSRCKIHRMVIFKVGGGAVDVDLFSRNLASDDIDVERIEDNGSGNTRIWLGPGLELPSYVNDSLTVAGSTTVGYNTTHKVTAVGTIYKTPHPTGNLRDQQNYIDTDQTYTADATGGTVTRALAAGEEALWLVVAPLTGTGSSDVLTNADSDEIEFVNRDPIGARNIGVNRKLYVRPATAATYVIEYMTQDIVHG